MTLSSNYIISKEAGAIDFVVKQANSVALIKAIRQAFRIQGQIQEDN